MKQVSQFICVVCFFVGLVACASYVPVDRNQCLGVLVSYGQKTNPSVNQSLIKVVKRQLRDQGFKKVVIVPASTRANAQKYFHSGSLTSAGETVLKKLSTRYKIHLLVVITDNQVQGSLKSTSKLLPRNYHVNLVTINKRVEASYRFYFIRLPENVVITERPGKVSVVVSQYDWGRAIVSHVQARQLVNSLNQYLISSITSDLKRLLVVG